MKVWRESFSLPLLPGEKEAGLQTERAAAARIGCRICFQAQGQGEGSTSCTCYVFGEEFSQLIREVIATGCRAQEFKE